MKLWIDDVRPAPSDEYIHIYTVEGAIKYITQFKDEITFISLDHDAGKFHVFGGDYIEILIWMEEKQFIDNWDFSHMIFEIHSGNPVGVQNMRRIIKHCGWTEYEDEYSFFLEGDNRMIDREKQIKTVLNELEQLVLKAGKETERLEEEYGGDTEEYWT